RSRVFNWETATYGKIRFDNDFHDLRSVETEFPTIALNDELSSEKTLSYESTASSLNDEEIDFRISFDESDDEDYAIICDKNSFSYKMIFVNNMKTDSENDNKKVNMPVLPPPEPTVSYFDDLDFLNEFENEFPSIVYNDETSLSEYDEVEQNVLYFNDLFPFNIIRPDDLKSDEDNDNNEIDFESRLAKIYRREVHRVQVFDFEGLPDLMAEGLSARIIITPPLPVIDLAEIVRLQIFVDIDDTWAWVALGPERQPDDVVGAPEDAEDAPVDDEDGQAILAPIQTPHPPPPLVDARSIPQRLGRLEEEMQGLRRDAGSLHELVERSITDQWRFSTWMIGCMVQLMEASGQTYQAFDGTFHGSSPAAFERPTRCRTSEASTSTAQQDQQQPDS
ncbi:hypothetical protein Tco_1368451, partial [Tanacetum coccineum]